MIKKYLYLLLLFISLHGAAQNLYFVNYNTHKIKTIKVGYTIHVAYKGYLGQTEYAKSTLTEINDSMITVGTDPDLFFYPLSEKMKKSPRYVYRKIYLKDIIAFRGMSPGRQLTKNVLLIGGIVGSYILLRELTTAKTFSPLHEYLITLSAGIGYNLMVTGIFSEHPKFFASDGWRPIVSYTKPVLPK